MFGLGTPELIVILAIAFLLFGGKKLPEIGSGLGKAIRSFKDGLDAVEETTGIEGMSKIAAVQDTIDKVKDINMKKS